MGTLFYKLFLLFSWWALVLAPPPGIAPARLPASDASAAVPGCKPDIARLAHPQLQRFYIDQRGFSSPTDNLAFVASVSADHSPGFFFQVENAVLKKLNDHGIRDKAITGALESLYTKIFFEELNKDRAGDESLRYQVAYSDYKSIRLRFDPNPTLENKFRDLTTRVAHRFDKEISLYPELKTFLDQSCGDCGSLVHWHVAGVGKSPEEAGARARLARERAKTQEANGHAILYGAHEEAGRLEDGIGNVETDRKELQRSWEKLFGHDNPLLKRSIRESVSVPSREFIELYRRYQDYDDASFIVEMEKAIKRRFELSLAPEDRAQFLSSIALFKKYVERLDSYIPSIYEPKEILDLGHGDGEFDLIAVDLAGQNARNLHAAMLAMSEGVRVSGPGPRLHPTLRLIRQNQDIASQEFEGRREKFTEAILKVYPSAKVIFSGDDGTFSPDRDFTPSEREQLVSELAALGIPSDFRLIYVHSKTADGGVRVEAKKKASLASIAEGLEKRLRRKMEGAISYRDLKELLFAVEIVPLLKGKHKINLIYSGRNIPGLEDRIRSLFLSLVPPVLSAGTVKYVPLP